MPAVFVANQVIKSTYVQAIPIYLASDVEVSRFFRDFKEEIDAFTNKNLIILVPYEVEVNNAVGIAAVIEGGKASRFGKLQYGDLPCLWIEDGIGRSEIIRLPETQSELGAALRNLADICRINKDVPRIVEEIAIRQERGVLARSPSLRTMLTKLNETLREFEMNKDNEKKVAVACGVIFVAAILIVSLFIPTPTVFQYTIFRIVIALAAAGFVSMTPGIIDVHVGKFIRAGGALAVFVIVYFYSPAAISSIK